MMQNFYKFDHALDIIVKIRNGVTSLTDVKRNQQNLSQI